MLPAPPEPSHRLATALHKLALAERHEAWREAHGRGLSPTQAQILALVAARPRTVSQLAEELGLTAGTVSASTSTLERKGLVCKRPVPGGGRARHVVCTPAGRAAADGDTSLPSFFADALDELDEEERRVLYRAALKMIRRLQREGRIPVSAMCITCTYFRPNVHPAPKPHHCALVDAPLADVDLRLDCPDHAPAPDDLEAENFARFRRSATGGA